MATQAVLDAISVGGSVLSLVGLGIAISQIVKTRKAADAAAAAARETQARIANAVILADLSTSTRSVEEVKEFIRSRKYEPALLRVSDLNHMVIQLQHLASSSTPPDWTIREMLTNLSVLRDLLEQRLSDDATEVDTAKVNAELSRIGDRLSHWIGGRKLTM